MISIPLTRIAFIAAMLSGLALLGWILPGCSNSSSPPNSNNNSSSDLSGLSGTYFGSAQVPYKWQSIQFTIEADSFKNIIVVGSSGTDFQGIHEFTNIKDTDASNNTNYYWIENPTDSLKNYRIRLHFWWRDKSQLANSEGFVLYGNPSASGNSIVGFVRQTFWGRDGEVIDPIDDAEPFVAMKE